MMLKSMNRYSCLLSLMLLAQGVFWHQTHQIRPELDVVPPPPGKAEVLALSFGDTEFHFRVLSLKMQNFGDLFGRFTSLRYYDFSRLFQWFNLLDTLDAKSDMVPNMATYYFAQTQNTPDVRYVVDYLYSHATHDVKHKWWWLLQALYLSMHKLNDMDLAAKIAAPMINPDVPVWAQQMVAVVHEKRGEMEDAYNIMQTISENAGTLSDRDLRYMTYFIKERLNMLDRLKQHPLAPESDNLAPEPLPEAAGY